MYYILRKELAVTFVYLRSADLFKTNRKPLWWVFTKMVPAAFSIRIREDDWNCCFLHIITADVHIIAGFLRTAFEYVLLYQLRNTQSVCRHKKSTGVLWSNQASYLLLASCGIKGWHTGIRLTPQLYAYIIHVCLHYHFSFCRCTWLCTMFSCKDRKKKNWCVKLYMPLSSKHEATRKAF